MTSSFGDGVTVVDQAAVYVVQPKCRSLSTTRRERNGAHPAPPGPSLTGHGTGPLLALVRWVRVAQFQRSRWNTAIHHGRLAALVNLQTRRIHFPLFVPLGFVFDFLPKTISMKFFRIFRAGRSDSRPVALLFLELDRLFQWRSTCWNREKKSK